MTDLCAEINKFGKGIGNEHRYRILQTLIRGPKSVNELVEVIKLSQPAISQHLKVLKESNLVHDERQGQEVFYSLNAEHTLTLLTALVKEMERSRKKHSA